MKSFVIVLVLPFFVSVVNIPTKIEKKIDKEILSIFDIDAYSKEPVVIEEKVNNSLQLSYVFVISATIHAGSVLPISFSHIVLKFWSNLTI